MNRNTLSLAVLLLVVIAGGVYVYSLTVGNESKPAGTSGTLPGTVDTKPTFEWRFEGASTNNLDGFPQTNIFLTATYAPNNKVEKMIDTVDGGCSVLEQGEARSQTVGTAVQCYYAGLGQRYRIIQGADSYSVERKMFEEALPDTAPKDYEWERMERF